MHTSTRKNRLERIEDAFGEQAAVLVVFLPGAYDSPHDIVEHGFVKALRTRGIAADAVMVDMHIGHYTADTVVECLREDIIVPAQKKGYAQIWLVGISLGGYGALLYSRRYGGDISGLFLMAPFLGNRTLLSEIAKTGLTAWQVGNIEARDYDRVLWSWLKGYSTQDQSGHPPLYVGYGTEDRFAGSNRILSAVLPSDRVMTTDGGHEWAPWHRLWSAFLDRDVLPKHA